ncbi:polyhydroxyalkanoate synthesis repressor PhaR [Formosimonas limnophila]|uniref:Polyhydroxyalkanoate synthesis repressor PhaR n=1 Tax=Formosimonas limnophila TaxID=1384487 RepID=A0A8J3G089_9BURK|nr:polyhydroxyalkanoate synthesis repressor PhaR [Formosimonas limnophila]GHA76483.1 polyhydroxyalkanoate synthesis repressor PhaR [Formosimonas limnophila]
MRKRNEQRIIKKYPNRRLYDTQTSTYITLADVKQMVLANEVFEVVDVKSNENLTRSILLQIILEEEAGGLPLFSSTVLSQIIRSYGNVMQGMLGSYLEKNMQAFAEIQSSLTEPSQHTMNNDTWQQLLSMQAPMMQGMMSNYIEQSKNMFLQMQEQMNQQANAMFKGFNVKPNDK